MIKFLDFLLIFLKSFEINYFELVYRMYGYVIEVGGSNISVDKVMGIFLLYWYGFY